ncbi:helix-turn-helix domain-containing protein [Elizabethkingia occulta]|uniref:Excisionase n=1 Tax=Elizabethkingia occulta TaxID=1867263 RepID=A0A1T3MMT7_9FLAO|nr:MULTISPECIES: helix-turn-helix domain-containing protein [Weeksellaceae]OPC65915.1 excisionase [Elizabethkingia occulta]
MDVTELSFENLPKAIAFLISEVAEIKSLVQYEQPISIPVKRIPIGVDAVCAIINKAKPTVYALVRKRMIPCYKSGRTLYFFEDEIVDWISKGKQKTLQEIASDAETHFKRIPLKK